MGPAVLRPVDFGPAFVGNNIGVDPTSGHDHRDQCYHHDDGAACPVDDHGGRPNPAPRDRSTDPKDHPPHEPSNHRADKPTGDHSTGEHPTSEHPTGDESTGDHSTGEHAGRTVHRGQPSDFLARV